MRSGTDSPPRGVERGLLRTALRSLGDPPVAFVLWDGSEICTATQRPLWRVRARSRRALWGLLRQPDVGFGEAYAEGSLEVDGDLVGLLEALFRAPEHWYTGLWQRRRRRRNANTRSGSRKNVHAHYDLGNDFYALWLDTEMQYTCAYFPTPEVTLEQAQRAKMDHVCRKLRLRPGERVVELGCGWGGLARHMARHYGADVTAYNISEEQVSFARERAQREGLDGLLRFELDDYRNAAGRYDAVVSVGMLEHVGRENYPILGRVIQRVMGSDGRGFIHSIGRARPLPMGAWIERNIFPGSYAPTLREMAAVFEPYDLAVLDVENLRLHYAKTLQHWLERFEKNADQVRSRFDERFVRIWRLYLAGSIASFTTGSLQLFQVLFAPAKSNAIPWTRADVYRGV